MIPLSFLPFFQQKQKKKQRNKLRIGIIFWFLIALTFKIFSMVKSWWYISFIFRNQINSFCFILIMDIIFFFVSLSVCLSLTLLPANNNKMSTMCQLHGDDNDDNSVWSLFLITLNIMIVLTCHEFQYLLFFLLLLSSIPMKSISFQSINLKLIINLKLELI